jgi:hypothetical protein
MRFLLLFFYMKNNTYIYKNEYHQEKKHNTLRLATTFRLKYHPIEKLFIYTLLLLKSTQS